MVISFRSIEDTTYRDLQESATGIELTNGLGDTFKVISVRNSEQISRTDSELVCVGDQNKSEGYSLNNGKKSIMTNEQIIYRGNMSKKNSSKSMFHPKSFNGNRFS